MSSTSFTVVPLSPERIMQIGFGFWGAKTLLSAVELGVFTGLGGGGKSLERLTADHGLHPRAARDFFDALVSLGMLRREGDGAAAVYLNTPETDRFLDRSKDAYLGGWLEMANARLYRFWGDLTTGLRSGEPQNEAKQGGDLFDELYREPARLAEFLSAMTGLSQPANREIARRISWSDYQTFVDIGTAQGDLPVQLALANPHLRGRGFDLEVVRPIFDAYVAKHGVSERVTFVAGDFFRDPLPPADVVLMGHILHDWDLATKRRLIRKAYEALPPGGCLVVHENLIDDERRTNTFGLLMSLNMLIETRGGFDYTGADCRGWMEEAGFRQTRVERLGPADAIVVGLK
jgi:SAM-dependent methyltransferase